MKKNFYNKIFEYSSSYSNDISQLKTRLHIFDYIYEYDFELSDILVLGSGTVRV